MRAPKPQRQVGQAEFGPIRPQLPLIGHCLHRDETVTTKLPNRQHSLLFLAHHGETGANVGKHRDNVRSPHDRQAVAVDLAWRLKEQDLVERFARRPMPKLAVIVRRHQG